MSDWVALESDGEVDGGGDCLKMMEYVGECWRASGNVEGCWIGYRLDVKIGLWGKTLTVKNV